MAPTGKRGRVMAELEIWRAAPRIRRGELTSVELVQAALARIDRFESDCRAWVLVDAREACRTAARLDQEVAGGRYRGPLHGIPIGIKDIVDVQGMPTRAGLKLGDGPAATADAAAVGRLRAAGAVILGKTVTTELACFDPPPTRNPWDPARTPGGSSSGSAVAVATGMCLAAVGSQTGGSIMRPAAYCGVCGLKPTFGRVDLKGVVPVSGNLDHLGPIARSATDLAYVLDAMASVPGLLERFSAQLRDPAPPRLGFFEVFFLPQAEQPVRAAVRSALECFQQNDATVQQLPLPEGFSQVHAMHRRIMAADAARAHAALLDRQPDQLGPLLRALLAEGRAVSDEAYAQARAHQDRFRRSAAEAVTGFDALITPATPAPAPPAAEGTGDPSFNSPWSYCGLPTVNLPCGTSPEGLPIAVQLVGRHGDDAELLSAAAWCQQRLPVLGPPPLVTDR